MTTEVRLNLVLRGGNLDLYNARDAEVLAEGPAGTGKTRTALELINDLCQTFMGLRVLMVRKTQVSMTTSCLAEFKKHVLHPGDGVAFFGGSKEEPAAFRYPGGAVIVVGGLDNAEKLLSSFYDLIYFNEATEGTLEDWEMLSSRLRGPEIGQEPRHKVTGAPFVNRRIMGDCNPTYASHWLMRRTDMGDTRLIRSKLEDNPAYYDANGQPTEEGVRYIARLDRLTGIRYQRFRLGKRVGVENAIYPTFDRLIHVRPLEPGLHFEKTIIGVDYGTEHECSLVALSIDQYRRRWVREAWAEADKDGGETLTLQVGRFKERYHTNYGRVDPNQRFLAGRTGFSVANGAAGSRMHRIDLLEPLFSQYEGGRVPSFRQEIELAVPRGPFAEPDSPGIFLVEGGNGNEELADELEAYHYVWSDTPTGKTKGVYRMGENRIAGLEYANEEYEEGENRDFSLLNNDRRQARSQPANTYIRTGT